MRMIQLNDIEQTIIDVYKIVGVQFNPVGGIIELILVGKANSMQLIYVDANKDEITKVYFKSDKALLTELLVGEKE